MHTLPNRRLKSSGSQISKKSEGKDHIEEISMAKEAVVRQDKGWL